VSAAARARSTLRLAILLGVTAGCGRQTGVETLVPAVRLIDLVRPSRTVASTHGADVTLDRDMRRTLVLPASTEQKPGQVVPDQPGGIPYEAFTHGLDWLARNRDRPCFIFLHNYVVHTPYLPPQP
jgi:hypothetical protein